MGENPPRQKPKKPKKISDKPPRNTWRRAWAQEKLNGGEITTLDFLSAGGMGVLAYVEDLRPEDMPPVIQTLTRRPTTQELNTEYKITGDAFRATYHLFK